VTHTQGETTLTVTAPTDMSAVDASPVTVTGTTAAGNTVYVGATNTDAKSATTVVSAPAAGDGSFSIGYSDHGGTTVLNVVAVSPSGATAHEQRTVVLDIVPGRCCSTSRTRTVTTTGRATTPTRRRPTSTTGLRHRRVPGLRRRQRRRSSASGRAT
jgi:hypothetical protein